MTNMQLPTTLKRSLPILGKFGFWLSIYALVGHVGNESELTAALSLAGVNNANLSDACEVIKEIASGKISDYFKEFRATEDYGINHHLQTAMRKGIINALTVLKNDFFKLRKISVKEKSQIDLFIRSLAHQLGKEIKADEQIDAYSENRILFFNNLLREVFSLSDSIASQENSFPTKALIPNLSITTEQELLIFLIKNLDTYIYKYINEELKVDDKAKTAYYIHLLEFGVRINKENNKMLISLHGTLADIKQSQRNDARLIKQINHTQQLIYELQRKHQIDFRNYVGEFKSFAKKVENKLNIDERDLKTRKTLPEGFIYLKDTEILNNTYGSLKYRYYLQNNYQTYVSREEFFREILKSVGENFETEKSIINKLSSFGNTSQREGCIIYGKGGIGKTRLMLEIGRLALKEEWQVIQVDSKVQTVQNLRKYLNKTEKYLLLFDYIEESQCFSSDIVSDILGNQNDILIRVVANCRNTYKTNSKFPKVASYLNVDLNDEVVLEKRYQKYVSDIIINSLLKKNDIVFSKFFNIKPSFSIFLKFMIEKSEKNIINDIRNEGDFMELIKKRFLSTFGKNSIMDIKEKVFYLFSVLPINRMKSEEINNTSLNKYITVLIDDGWLEEGKENELKAIHDTITDEILLIFLDKTSSNVRREISSMMKFAIKYDLLPSFVRSMERIVGQKNIPDSNFYYQEFGKLIISSPNQMSNIKNTISVTSLLSESDRLVLMYNNINFFLSYIKTPFFANPLSFALNTISKENLNEQLREILSDLFNIWHEDNANFMQDYKQAYKITSTAIKFFGITHFTSKCVLDYLSEYAHKNNSSFVIQSWLDNNGSVDLIKNFIRLYLKNNIYKYEVRYVLAAYVRNAQDFNNIRGYLKLFLEKNIDDKNNTYIILTWIVKGGSLNFIKPFIEHNLKIQTKKNTINYLLTYWLKYKGNPKIIELYVNDYLKNYGQDKDASHIIEAWIEAEGNLKFIEENVVSYLNTFSGEINTSYVLQPWLEKDGDLSIVERHLREYINNYYSIPQTRHLIELWLKKEYPLNIIENQIYKYLEYNISNPVVNSVLQAWLYNGYDVKLLEKYIIEFLDKHLSDRSSDFILQQWLNKGGAIQPIEKYLNIYLENNCKILETNYLIQAWIDRANDINDVKNYVKCYLENNPYADEIVYVMRVWIKKGGSSQFIEEAVKKYLKNYTNKRTAIAIIQLWLNKCENPNRISKYVSDFLAKNTDEFSSRLIITSWLSNSNDLNLIMKYSLLYLELYSETDKATYVLKAWLKNFGKPEYIEEYLIRFLKKYYKQDTISHLLKAWLNSGGDRSVVEPYILYFLEEHKDYRDYENLLNIWQI